MGKHMYAQLGVAISGIISLIWFVLCTFPVNWLRFENAIVGFEVTLWHVYTRHGIGSALFSGFFSLVGARETSSSFDSLMSTSITLTEAKMKFCAITLPGMEFCYMWEKAWYASWTMMIMGYFGVIFFGIGSAAMYYYAFSHATETGRIWARVMFVIAPVCCLMGVITFLALTFDFGTGLPKVLSFNSHAYWGPGFMLSMALIPLSFLPIYILTIFGKPDRFEKRRGEGYDDDDEETYNTFQQPQPQPGSSYGWGSYQSQPQSGYAQAGYAGQGGSYQQTAYVVQQQYQTPVQPAQVQQQVQWTSGPSVPGSQLGQNQTSAHSAQW